MTERKLSGRIEALEFLRANPQAWQSWVPEKVARKVADSLARRD